MHLGGHSYNRVEVLTSKGAEKSTVASDADCEVEADSLTAGHERKHNACRAESEVVLVVIPISAESCFAAVFQRLLVRRAKTLAVCAVRFPTRSYSLIAWSCSCHAAIASSRCRPV